MLPRLIHFIFGMTPQDRGNVFGFCEYLALLATAALHPRHKLVMWHGHGAPENPLWVAAGQLCEMVWQPPPEGIHGRRLAHPAHRADVLRLLVLREHGGIYLDTDMLPLRPFDSLFVADTAMAQQIHPEGQRPEGLGNSVILSRARAGFLGRWLDAFESFHSHGLDSAYDYYGVKLPMILARQSPGDITVLPHTSFFRWSWEPEGIAAIFREVHATGDAWCQHLWAAAAREEMAALTPQRILTEASTYNLAMRPHLARMPAGLFEAFTAWRAALPG